MHHNPLSVHGRIRNILTGDPLVGAGALRHGRSLHPMRDPEPAPGDQPAPGQADATKAAADKAAAEKAATDKALADKTAADAKAKADADAAAKLRPGAGPDGKTDAERGWRLGVEVEDLKPEEQAAYWKAFSRKHEGAYQKLVGKDMTPEKVAALLKQQEDAEEANKTETQRLVDAARKEGEESARAGALEGTVKALVAAHVVAAKLDKTKDADTLETLETLNHSSFIGEDHTIDAAKLSKVLNRLAPIGGGNTSSGAWPATGQGNQNSGTGSAKDAGHAEAVRRGYRKADAGS